MSNPNDIVDLRSDTVTKPCAEMREVMMKAPVGDDVYGADPTVNELEAYVADLFGKEAALYNVSGTMSNQIAISLFTRPGDEVLMHAMAHPSHHEAGGCAANSGVNCVPLPGENGLIDPNTLHQFVREDDHYMSRTSLLTLENTHNMAGGRVVPLQLMNSLCSTAKKLKLKVHLDGARLFNASVKSGNSVAEICAGVDSASFCLSKGLGAPIGSMLVGERDFIREARRVRTRLGGAWRQAGLMAAGGLFALRNNVNRLAEDHRRALMIRDLLEGTSAYKATHEVETNILYMEPTHPQIPGGIELENLLKTHGVLVNATGPRSIRFVTHLDVNDEDIRKMAQVMEHIAAIHLS
jgi:threonine aldolase